MKSTALRHILIAGITMLLAACTNDLSKETADPFGFGAGEENLVPVEFSLSEKIDFTRAVSSIVTFDESEKVRVCVKPDGSSSYADYDYTTAEDGQTDVGLTAPAAPPYFPPGTGTTVQAYAYYPSPADAPDAYSTSNNQTVFTVAADQTSDAAYKQSDLMYCANQTITKPNSATLSMAHQMAQLHLNVTGVGLTVYKVVVNACNSVTFAPNTNAVTTTRSGKADIVAGNGPGDAYVCIPQQQIAGVSIKIWADAVGTADKTATFTFTSESNFAAATSYPINLTINAGQLGATTTITDWNGAESMTFAPSGDLTIDIDQNANITYTGSEIRPGITVKKEGVTVARANYTVQYFSNINAGNATILVLGKADTDYEGSIAVASFSIHPKTLTAGMIGAITSPTYSGSQLTPAVTVTDGSTLTLNTDYTLSYGENINVSTGGSVTVTGQGNYTGSATKNFNISPKSISGMTLTLNQTGTTYTGSPITASVSSLVDGTKTLASGTEYTVANSSTLSATNAAANASAEVTQNTITVNGTGNYTGSKSGTWHINRASPTLTISSYSPNPMNLTGSNRTGTINVTRSGDGAVTATSSNTLVVGVTSVSSTTVNLTAVADGSATITVKMSQGTNYTAYTASDKYVTASVAGITIAPRLGDKYYSDGSWGNNNHSANATVIGVVAWLGTDSDLKCGKSHGLVMAKSDVSGTYQWGPTGTDESFLNNIGDTDGSIDKCKNYNKNGLTNTDSLINDEHDHPAALAARSYDEAPSTSGNTNWFLPSEAQWLAVLGAEGLGKQSSEEAMWGNWFDTDLTAYTNINNALGAEGVEGAMIGAYVTYWTSSELTADRAGYLLFHSSGIHIHYMSKATMNNVRAFLAF